MFFSKVVAADAAPSRWLLWVHGVFGSGQNFRTVAREVVHAEPTWGACLVDLRAHGSSPDLSPPHTVSSMASDLMRLEEHLPGPVCGVVGHSLGGKVALVYMDLRRAAQRQLDVGVILDANPSPRPRGMSEEMAAQVLSFLEALPPRFSSRNEFVERVVEHGYAPSIAAWLAMNLAREGESLRWRTNLTVIRAVLTDYFELDAWPIVESEPTGHTLFVLGGTSQSLSDAERQRLMTIGEATPSIVVETVPNAGHWVHADAPQAVASAIIRHLRTGSG